MIVTNGVTPIQKMSFGELKVTFPKRRPEIISGLCREGETINLISHAKAGKSWLSYGLALSIITGRKWLDSFDCAKGRVLLIDLELHPEELQYRIGLVAEAMGIDPSEIADGLDVWLMRGNQRSVFDLQKEFTEGDYRRWKAIIIDSKYRLTSGSSENDNAGETLFYNAVDAIAHTTRAAIVLVHHTSKGDQSDRAVTDLGSGAGAQNRAADGIIAIRRHQLADCGVLAGEIRSNPRPKSIGLRFDFPLWRLDKDVDVRKLGSQKATSQKNQDDAAIQDVLKVLTDAPQPVSALVATSGIGRKKLDRLLGVMVSRGLVCAADIVVRSNQTIGYSRM